MLSFHMVQSGGSEALQIYFDDEGEKILMTAIANARKFGHIHLMAPMKLAERTPYGELAIQEVMVDYDGDLEGSQG